MKITYPKNNKRKRGRNLLLVLFFLLLAKNYAQVGVNILTPHSSAALQIESPTGTAKGLLTPTMTTVQRVSINTGTQVAADGLIVYDKDHHMHYYYSASLNKWVSMSPLILTAVGSSSIPSGVITTPSGSATFSLGINKQNPTQVLDIIGNATVSGNVNTGGNVNVNGNASVNGNTNVSGTLTVTGFASNALVPTGAIVMWSGTLIPLGWGLCDGGTYGGLTTPDLRGRFIVGVDNLPNTQVIATGQYVVSGQTGTTPLVAPNTGTVINYGTIGNTGGENGHTLSLAEMPSHTHNVNAAVTNSNVFGFNVGFGNISIGNGSAASGDTQTVSVSITEAARGSGTTHENRPPYYVLAYIIKLP